MNIVAVDDERLALDDVIRCIKEVMPGSGIFPFTDPEEALTFVSRIKNIDVILLDVEMYGMNGIELGIAVKKICPKINIIFITGFKNYALDSLRIHASGYLMKPVSKDELRHELDNLRHPIERLPGTKVTVRTFGAFEVYVGTTPVSFARSKARECFAYLIDRKGAGVTSAEIAGILWENRELDRSLQSQLQNVISCMVSTFRALGCEDVIIKKRNSTSVNPSLIDCDYYRLLEGDVSALNSFEDNYMPDYDWARFTSEMLVGKKEKLGEG